MKILALCFLLGTPIADRLAPTCYTLTTAQLVALTHDDWRNSRGEPLKHPVIYQAWGDRQQFVNFSDDWTDQLLRVCRPMPWRPK